MTKRLMLLFSGAVLIVGFQAKAVVVVQPQAAPGRIEGVVIRADSRQPIPNAQITLSGGAIDLDKISRLADVLNKVANVPQDNIFNQTRLSFNEHFQRAGLSGQPLLDAIINAMQKGVPASPANAVLEDRILQGAIYIGRNLGLSPYNSDFSAALLSYRGSTASFKTMTDRSGRFVLENVPAGSYIVRAERDGFFGAEGTAVPQTAAATATVTAAGTASVNVPMRPGATISGRLMDEGGLPLANANVQAFTVDYNSGVPTLRVAANNKTDDRGQYSLFWLPPGDYLVAYTHATTSIVADQTALKQTIGVFYPGTPGVTNAVPVVVKAGDNSNGIDFRHRAVRPVKVSGTVHTDLLPPLQPGALAGNSTIPVRTSVLMLLQRDTSAPDDVGAREVGTVTFDNTGLKGEFQISIPPGSYDLFARIPTPGGVMGITFGRTAIDVRDEELKGLDIEVHAAVTGGGTLNVNGAVPGQSNIRVLLRSDDSSAKLPAYTNLMQRVVPVQPDGTFTLPALFVGHYAVMVEGLSPGMYVADVRQGAASISDTGTDITSRPPSPLEVSIKTDSASLQGTVTDLERKPSMNATVVVVPPENRRRNRMLYWTATTDANGRFSILGIAPGNYKVFAWSNLPAGAYFNSKFLAKHEAGGRSITAGPSATINANITAIPLD